MKTTNYTDTLEELFNQNVNRESNNQQQQNGGDFTVSFPSTFEDIKGIIDTLRKGGSALVNFNKVTIVANRQRFLDYLSGATYALGASMRKIQESQYLITASGVTIKVNK